MAAITLSGCALQHAPMLDPKGPIALAERDLLFGAIGLMLIVLIPVFALTFWFVWRYRASAQNPDYQPEWDRSATIEATIWVIPALIVAAVATMVWKSSHELDPYRAISSVKSTVTVQAVALDWKWLFIYPNERVATVNELVIPVETPVRIIMTSDTVMNSLAIPALAGQVYVMAGMQTELNILASEEGVFTGRNLQYSGSGFPNQTFVVSSVSPNKFDAWLQAARNSQQALDPAAYGNLTLPSEAHPVVRYRDVQSRLFESIIAKYAQRPAVVQPGTPE